MPGPKAKQNYESLLIALRDMPLDEATTMRDKLVSQRAWIDGQIAMFEQIIRSRNGGTPPSTPEHDAGPKLSRRMILLTEMAKAHDHPWTTNQLRGLLLEQGSIEDDAEGTATLHKNLGRMKRRGEIERVARSRYRITPTGIEALRAAS